MVSSTKNIVFRLTESLSKQNLFCNSPQPPANCNTLISFKPSLTGKTPLFVIGPFCFTILFVLTLASDRAVLNGNTVCSILVVSTKKRFEKGFLFPENLFQS